VFDFSKLILSVRKTSQSLKLKTKFNMKQSIYATDKIKHKREKEMTHNNLD